MLLRKTFHFERCDGLILSPTVLESFDEENIIFTWDSALLLSAYLITIAQQSSILEIGSGTGLPSVVSKILRAKMVVTTERGKESYLLENLKKTMMLNDFESDTVLPLSWDGFDVSSIPCFQSIDIVMGADVLYSSEDFDPVLALVKQVLSANPSAMFLTAYKNRSSRRTLVPYLDVYELCAEEVPLDSFLGQCHQTGCCATSITTLPLKCKLSTVTTQRQKRKRKEFACTHNDEAIIIDIREDIPSFQDIHLLKIYLRSAVSAPPPQVDR